MLWAPMLQTSYARGHIVSLPNMQEGHLARASILELRMLRPRFMFCPVSHPPPWSISFHLHQETSHQGCPSTGMRPLLASGILHRSTPSSGARQRRPLQPAAAKQVCTALCS